MGRAGRGCGGLGCPLSALLLVAQSKTSKKNSSLGYKRCFKALPLLSSHYTVLRFPARCFKVTEHIAAGRCGRICPPTSLMNLFNLLFFFWPSGSSDTALGGVIKAFHDICECDLLPPPRPGVNHCGAHVLSHEIPLSHGGTLLNSAWQVLRLVLGRQTAEFHQRDGERLQPKVTDNLFLFFF